MIDLNNIDKTKFNNNPYVKKVEKPWGYELHWVPEDKPYMGKIEHLNAGARMSLQIHDAKQESWFLMNGKAKVIWEDASGNTIETEMETGKGYTCSLGQKHRLAGLTDCDIIEVSTPEMGTTLRLEDDYKRPDETPEQRKAERGELEMRDFTDKHYASRTQEKMMDVLMDQNAVGPAIHYHMVRGGSDQRNITVWEPGTISGEYIKTYGHYHVGKLDETYWVIFGEGVVLVQKRAIDAQGNPIDDEIDEAYAVRVKTGDALFIPAEWGHLVVNISKTFFATADDSPVNFEEVDPVSLPGHADYEAVKKMQGFCYYVVEQNGKPALVKNDKYKRLPKISIISASEYPLKKA